MNLSYQFHLYDSGQIELAIFNSTRRIGFYPSIDQLQMEAMKSAAEKLGSRTMVIKH